MLCPATLAGRIAWRLDSCNPLGLRCALEGGCSLGMNKWILNREQEPPKWEQPMDKISQNVDMPRHSQSTQRHRQRYQMSTNVNFSVRSDRVGARRARCKAHAGITDKIL